MSALAKVEFDLEQVGLIKRTICPGATDDELTLFLGQCRRTGLDPFAKQIYAVKRNGKMVIQIGIDGYRLIADRTGQYAGSDDPVFDNEENPRKATVTVYKLVGGLRCPFTATARWAQYYPGDAQGFMWKKMPHLMLSKCAESLALRKAFPAELSGLYSAEEMEQAGAPDGDERRPVIEVKQIAEAPKQAQPEPAKPAASLPASGQELHRRLQDYDAKLAAQKLCVRGELLAYVSQAGVRAGYGPSISEWSGPAISLAAELVKAFETERRQPKPDEPPTTDALFDGGGKKDKKAVAGTDAQKR